jgi:hypothetical protein
LHPPYGLQRLAARFARPQSLDGQQGGMGFSPPRRYYEVRERSLKAGVKIPEKLYEDLRGLLA